VSTALGISQAVQRGNKWKASRRVHVLDGGAHTEVGQLSNGYRHLSQ